MLGTASFVIDLAKTRYKTPEARAELNPVGLRLVFAVYEDGEILDISTATTLTICAQSPAGVDKEFVAAFLDDGADGEIYYDIADADIDEEGTWKLTVKLEGATFTRIAFDFCLLRTATPICA